MTNTDEHTVSRLIDALASGDRPALEEILDEDARLQALLPRRYVELTGPAVVAGEMLGWFEDVPEVVPVHTHVETVGDVWHAAYRFALRGTSPEQVVEQHAYCTLADGSITAIRLVCSGFRPATPVEAAQGDAARSAAAGAQADRPKADRHIEALGYGCASLTPRIAAELRELPSGGVLAVLTDDPSAPHDIAAWTRMTGHQIVAATTEVAGTRYYLRHA